MMQAIADQLEALPELLRRYEAVKDELRELKGRMAGLDK